MSDTMVLSQADIEGEITRLSNILENTTEEFGKAIREAKQAEADYRIEYAKAFTTHRLGADKVSEKTAEMMATVNVAANLRLRLSKEAIERYLEEKCRSLRAQLDAVRTLSANVRAQT
jgi:hypothetical protein